MEAGSLVTYFVLFMVCAIVVQVGCAYVTANPWDWKPWIIVVPAFTAEMEFLVLMLKTAT